MSFSDAIYIATKRSQVDVLKAFIQHLKHEEYTIERIDNPAREMFDTNGLENVILTAWHLTSDRENTVKSKLNISTGVKISIDIDKFADLSKVREELVYALLQYLILHNATCAYAAADYDVILLYSENKLKLLIDYPLWEGFPEIIISHEFKELPKI